MFDRGRAKQILKDLGVYASLRESAVDALEACVTHEPDPRTSERSVWEEAFLFIPEEYREKAVQWALLLQRPEPVPTIDRAALEEAWDEGNATGLDGWVGPSRGAGDIDQEAVVARRRDVDRILALLRPDPRIAKLEALCDLLDGHDELGEVTGFGTINTHALRAILRGDS